MENKNRVHHLKIAGNALIAAVPLVGSSINSLISDYQTKRKHDRLLMFYNSLRSDWDKYKDEINQDFISEDDFLDLFEETARKIVLERKEDKRIAFKNILLNSCLANKVDYDYVEENIRLLERLRSEHLLFLRLFDDPRKVNDERSNPLGEGGGFTTSINQLLNKLIPEWSGDKIIDVCSDLENERLLGNVVANYKTMMTDRGIIHLENKLTEKGKKFYQYISLE